MKAEVKRKQDECGRKISTSILYVVKDKYIDIVEVLPRHQESIRNLKESGHEVIGYIRKSTGEKDDNIRIRLLKQMCCNLRERFLVTKVFASVSCNANQPFLARDSKKNHDMLSKINVDGDMQDLLAYIYTKEKICIVAIDFAGLTMNCEDLELFLKNHRNIVKLIIDKLPYSNSIHVYNSDELLNNPNKLQGFKCRKNTLF
ncbi:hypothetical protein INT46_001574 [Mucor plumbeus]|uniref:Uncharacterized protein n=1 Tax=Mucor plumbeus TaxID=97098 RepID=A0A8H7R1P5_9FUNG|nr:hypothetical protein INT46_001574 [Mucor plumbeus]